jgi:tRNA-uridine 2-sulfurtransferase
LRVAVLMSGGVDSSVAAARLLEMGHEVVGLTMRVCFFDADEQHDAPRVAAALGIPHHFIDCEDDFSRLVVSPFVAEYKNGRTPSPCIGCNRDVKFHLMWEHAHTLECEAISTGHYARLVHDADGAMHIMKAKDSQKDQTYFLSRVARADLERAIFPLGEMTKEETRQYAHRLGLEVAEKPESQEVCFVPDDYRGFLAGRDGFAPREGKTIRRDGTVVGTHNGYWNFTIGQRRGVNVALGEPVYVADIIPESNTVVVGVRKELESRSLSASRVNALVPLEAGMLIEARIRSQHRGTPARIDMVDDRVRFDFEESVFGVTPGQCIAWYRGDELCGGAIIDHAL